MKERKEKHNVRTYFLGVGITLMCLFGIFMLAFMNSFVGVIFGIGLLVGCVLVFLGFNALIEEDRK